MSGFAFFPPQFTLVNSSGRPYAGAVARFYEAGTNTPLTVYTTAALSTAHGASVTADAAGAFAPVFIDPEGGDYKVSFFTSGGSLIRTVDNIPATYPLTASQVGAALYPRTAAEISAAVTTSDYSYPAGNVLRYGADPTGASDSTAAIQAAINSNDAVVIPDGTYLCANLTQTANFQTFTGLGSAILKKNANGPILTSSGDTVVFQNVNFRGDAATPTYTGDNLVSSGDDLRLLNCGSRWAYGAAVKATGSQVQILGSCDIYQTATGAGYDIEIGVSGTATYYHSIIGINTTQATGGIKFIDTGSAFVQGCQFGKLLVDAGTSPSGSNGGTFVGNRILGAVTVELASAVFTGNQFGSVAITLAAGTSGCILVGNVYGNGHTVTNSGNANNLIERETSAGSVNKLKYGGDTSTCEMEFDPSSGDVNLVAGDFGLPNAKGVKFKDNSGDYQTVLSYSSGDIAALANPAGTIQFSASNGVYQIVSIPTSSAGLPAGAIYSDGGTIKIVS